MKESLGKITLISGEKIDIINHWTAENQYKNLHLLELQDGSFCINARLKNENGEGIKQEQQIWLSRESFLVIFMLMGYSLQHENMRPIMIKYHDSFNFSTSEKVEEKKESLFQKIKRLFK